LVVVHRGEVDVTDVRGDRFHRGARQRKRELLRLAAIASVDWRVIPVTWGEICDEPDAVLARAVPSLAV